MALTRSMFMATRPPSRRLGSGIRARNAGMRFSVLSIAGRSKPVGGGGATGGGGGGCARKPCARLAGTRPSSCIGRALFTSLKSWPPASSPELWPRPGPPCCLCRPLARCRVITATFCTRVLLTITMSHPSASRMVSTKASLRVRGFAFAATTWLVCIRRGTYAPVAVARLEIVFGPSPSDNLHLSLAIVGAFLPTAVIASAAVFALVFDRLGISSLIPAAVMLGAVLLGFVLVSLTVPISVAA
eukprot:scaffold63700_cov27-Tisochrysis_lutea.AAC.1